MVITMNDDKGEYLYQQLKEDPESFVNQKDEDSDKWIWKMEYCKKHRLPPAENWAWNKAEEAWTTRVSE